MGKLNIQKPYIHITLNPDTEDKMKKIIIMTDRADRLSPYLEMLDKLFPDCEIRTIPREKSYLAAHNIIRKDIPADGKQEY